jgi:hypothetical protein
MHFDTDKSLSLQRLDVVYICRQIRMNGRHGSHAMGYAFQEPLVDGRHTFRSGGDPADNRKIDPGPMHRVDQAFDGAVRKMGNIPPAGQIR